MPEQVAVRADEANAGAVSRRWHAGRAVLDERSLELTLDGSVVAMDRKSLEVLRYLLHHAGEVVTKDDLEQAIWPGRILSETVLTKCVSRLRQRLGDDHQMLIKTVHGYGYRLLAPVRAELLAPTPIAALNLRAGDAPPLRPNWMLVRRLDNGGRSEAWLGRHTKTHEQCVFKFALDGVALTSLKREITLYRLLHDSLGDSAAVVALLDWNLEQAPCFTESTYVDGGNIVDWAERQGGLAEMPLSTRLELAAQIAEALAAAHSVGVLHKGLRPSSALVGTVTTTDNAPAYPRIQLCGFGSGEVLDHCQLAALDITHGGFTPASAAEITSGPQVYLAPEILAGQPATVRADLYALGVMLYQIVVGDFDKTLAPGWEREVEDELLRDDIALAAAGDPARRLSDAAHLAERLRGLPQRRENLRMKRANAKKLCSFNRESSAAIRDGRGSSPPG